MKKVMSGFLPTSSKFLLLGVAMLQFNKVDTFMSSPVGVILSKKAMRSHLCRGSIGGTSTTRMCLDPKQPARGRSTSPVGRSRPDPTSPSSARSDSRSSSVDAKKTILAEFTDMWLPDDLALDMEMEGFDGNLTSAEFVPLPGKNQNPIVMPPKRYSSGDWLHNIISIPTSITLRRIFSHLFANTLLAVVVWWMTVYHPSRIVFLTKGLTTSAHGLISGALGLMLVFRTNSAYDRYWEARKIWGGMINKLREMARMAHTSMNGWDREHLLQLMGAFAPILLQHLRTGGRGSFSQKEALKGILSESDVEIVWLARNRPYVLLKMIGAIIRRTYSNAPALARQHKLEDGGKHLSAFEVAVVQADLITERQHIEHMLTGLTETIGMAERIVKTTVPLSYSRHTSRFLSVWCFTLPLVLVESLQWRMIPCVAIITWSLLCIEEVGNIIEDPFNMPFVMGVVMDDELKLERSFKNIRSDVMDRLPATSSFLQHLGGDFLCYKDYDVGEFHEAQRKSRGRSDFTQPVDQAAKAFVWQDIATVPEPDSQDDEDDDTKPTSQIKD